MNTQTTFDLPTVDAPSISSSAMLVELNISCWTGRKQDKNLSDKSESAASAARGTFSTYKKLLGDCAELKAVSDSAAAIRSFHLRNTMPWSDKGPRLLTTQRFFSYEQEMSVLADKHQVLVDTFVDEVYAGARVDAFRALGDAYDPNEYPSTPEIAAKFGFHLTYSPVPDTGDFRVNVGNEALAKLASQYSSFYAKRIDEAQRDVTTRLTVEMERFVAQLHVDDNTGKKGKLFQATIDHVLSLSTMLEEANFSQDPAITSVVGKIQALVGNTEAADLKKNEAARAELHKQMQVAVAAIPSMGF